MWQNWKFDPRTILCVHLALVWLSSRCMFSFAPKLGFISLFSCMRRIRNTCNAARVLCGHWISCCLRPSLFLWPLARICLSDSTPLSLCISSLSFPASLILLCCRPSQHHCMRSTRIISQQRTSDLDFLCNTGPLKDDKPFLLFPPDFPPCSVLTGLSSFPLPPLPQRDLLQTGWHTFFMEVPPHLVMQSLNSFPEDPDFVLWLKAQSALLWKEVAGRTHFLSHCVHKGGY